MTALPRAQRRWASHEMAREEPRHCAAPSAHANAVQEFLCESESWSFLMFLYARRSANQASAVIHLRHRKYTADTWMSTVEVRPDTCLVSRYLETKPKCSSPTMLDEDHDSADVLRTMHRSTGRLSAVQSGIKEHKNDHDSDSHRNSWTRSRALMARRNAAVPRRAFHATPIFAARAEGAASRTSTATTILILPAASGASTWVTALRASCLPWRDQLDRFLHVCFSVTTYESYIAVAEKTERPGSRQICEENSFADTGAKPFENSIKIARAYTKRPAGDFVSKTLSMPHTAHDVADEQDPSLYRPLRTVRQRYLRIPFAYPYRSEQGASAATFGALLGRCFKRLSPRNPSPR